MSSQLINRNSCLPFLISKSNLLWFIHSKQKEKKKEFFEIFLKRKIYRQCSCGAQLFLAVFVLCTEMQYCFQKHQKEEKNPAYFIGKLLIGNQYWVCIAMCGRWECIAVSGWCAVNRYFNCNTCTEIHMSSNIDPYFLVRSGSVSLLSWPK